MRMRATITAAVLLAAVLAAAACSGSGDDAPDEAAAPADATTTTVDVEDPEDAFLRQMDLLSKGQYGRLYEELHPDQRAFIDAETFDACYSDMLAGVDVTNVEVVETFEEDAAVPGTGKTVPSTAITAAITVAGGGAEETDTDTFHVYLVDGRWVFTVADADGFRDGTCSA